MLLELTGVMALAVLVGKLIEKEEFSLNSVFLYSSFALALVAIAELAITIF